MRSIVRLKKTLHLLTGLSTSCPKFMVRCSLLLTSCGPGELLGDPGLLFSKNPQIPT